jgi:hypothetical protein
VETSQLVNTGHITVQAPFIAQWIETNCADFVNGPDGFTLGNIKVIQEDCRFSSRHGHYDHPSMMMSYMRDSYVSEIVGTPSSMLNEGFASERGSKPSSGSGSWNSTPDQSLVLSHMHGWIEVVSTPEGDLEMSEVEDNDMGA